MRAAYLSERSAELQQALRLEKMRLSRAVDTLRNDVVFLANTPPVFGIIRARYNNGFDPRDLNSQERWETRLQEIFAAFASAHPDYQTLRYVDSDGRELVRVDHHDGASTVPAREGLGMLANPALFNALGTLSPGMVYVSELLHQSRHTGSLIPTAIAATPVFGLDGRLFGALVVNMDLTLLLQHVVAGRPQGGQAFVTDMHGRYLRGPMPSPTDMPSGLRGNIVLDFPQLAALLKGKQESQDLTEMRGPGGAGHIVAERVHFDTLDPARFLLLAYYLPAATAHRQIAALTTDYLAGAIAIMLLVGAAVLLVSRRAFASLERVVEAADRIVAGDQLTQLPVRSGGESGRLADALTAMLDKLAQREREIAAINAGLERQIAERTREVQFNLRQATLLLRRNEALMTTSMDGIHILDTEGRVIEANEAFCQMLGYGYDEVLRMKVTDWDVCLPADELRSRFEAVIGQSKRIETVNRRKDGVLIDVEISISGVDLDGEAVIFAVSRDITARKRAEAALRRHRIVIETVRDGFWLTDENGYLIEVNQAYAEMSGYTPEELIGKHISELEAAENPEEVASHIRKVLDQGHDFFETRHRRKDGQEIDIEISVATLPESRQIFVFCRNITERKRADEALRIAAATFETHDAIVITDAQARIIKVNRAFTAITGYSAGEVLGKGASIMRSGHHDRAFYEAMWRDLLESGTWAGEIWDRRKDGEVYPKWMTITAVRNSKGETTRYVAIFSDITERKNAETEIRNLAFYDPLTELPNRRLFLDRFSTALAASERQGLYGAAMFIDMDHFKYLNDTHGHEYGDLMLVEVARRIRACVREVDTVARLGGDEFVVLIEGIAAGHDDAVQSASRVAESIRIALASPYQLREHRYHSSPSIGISLFRGTEHTIDELLRQADTAMYHAKQNGRNAVCFFDPASQGAKRQNG